MKLMQDDDSFSFIEEATGFPRNSTEPSLLQLLIIDMHSNALSLQYISEKATNSHVHFNKKT